MVEDKPETTDKTTEEPKQFDWNIFFNIPEVRQAIPSLIETWAKNLEIKERIAHRAGWRFLAMTLILFALIIGCVIWLALAKILSSDAIGFMLGAIITGAIAVVRDFTGGR